MILELGIADAYSCAFEYARPGKDDHRKNNLSQYYSHPRHKQIPGHYTDDTEMSIGIAELLIEKSDWTALNIANKFVSVFKRNGQRTGYSMKFYEFLCEVRDGKEFLTKITPKSTKSGAAMRACPLGYLQTTDEVMEKAEIQAKVTHNTLQGIISAQAIALMAHSFIYNKLHKEDVPAYLEQKLRGVYYDHNFKEPWTGKVGEQGLESAHAAVQTVATSNSLSEILMKCVDYGGDTDTVAVMAVGAASCCEQIEKDLPEGLYWGLENGPYGRDYLAYLDSQLGMQRNWGIK